jgi:FolB domain-containing protein
MAVIYIKDLVVEATHGLHPHEKTTPQRFRISAELTVDLAKAGVTDDIDDTLNWSEVRGTIVKTVQNTSFNLVERLAQEIINNLLVDKRIRKVTVSVDKLDAFESGVPGVRLS